MVDVRIDEKKEMLVWSHSGMVTELDLISAIDKTKDFANRFPNLKLLELNNDSPVSFGVTKTLDIAIYAKKYFHLFNSVKHAFVSNTPINIASFIMLISSRFNVKHKIKAFSTKEAAIEWLSEK